MKINRSKRGANGIRSLHRSIDGAGGSSTGEGTTALGRAAVYVRVSSVEQEQEGVSLSAQESLLRRAAGDAGYAEDSIVLYRDVERAWDSERPGFEDLRRSASRGEFSAVYIYDLTRLSRDVEDAIRYLREFQHDWGCRVTFLNDPVDTSTPTGNLFFILKAAMGQHEREQIGQRVRFSAQKLIADGKRATGMVPFGFEKLDKHVLVPHPTNADTVRRIFKEYADGKGTMRIARGLDEDGVPPPGKGWRGGNIERILNCPAHHGINKWGDLVSPWPFARLVDPTIARRVEERLNSRQFKAGPDTPTYEWYGLVRCGICGRSMRRSRVNTPNRTYDYVRCEDPYDLRSGQTEHHYITSWLLAPLRVAVLEKLAECYPGVEPEYSVDASRELEGLEEQRRRLAKVFMLGEIGDQEYEGQLRKIVRRMGDIEELAVPARHHQVMTLASDWSNLTIVEKNSCLRLLVTAAAVYSDKLVAVLRPYGWPGWPEQITIPRPAKGKRRRAACDLI